MNDSKNMELLDVKCHIRLADIAHSLLKVSPYDPDTMACRGLQRYTWIWNTFKGRKIPVNNFGFTSSFRYMLFILPRAEWANDALRAALVQILRRLDKVFLKISKKPSIRVSNWRAFLLIAGSVKYFLPFRFSAAKHGLGSSGWSIERNSRDNCSTSIRFALATNKNTFQYGTEFNCQRAGFANWRCFKWCWKCGCYTKSASIFLFNRCPFDCTTAYQSGSSSFVGACLRWKLWICNTGKSRRIFATSIDAAVPESV